MDEQVLQKIIADEKEYGVDYEQIERRYHFIPANRYEAEMEFDESHDKEDRTGDNALVNNSNDKFDAIYLPPGSITPSQSHSISPQDELRLRIAGAEMIQQAGYSLKLPWYTIATGQALFQRFYYRVSFLDYDIRESLMACLFIATKIQESPRKLRDITTVFYHVFQVRQGRQPPIAVLNSASDYYQYIKSMVMDSERIVLKELGFELYRLTEHAHNFLLDYLKRLKTSKEVAKKAWNYVNDAYKGTICLHYPPHIIAVSCLYLAIWTTKTPMPRNIWWAIFDTSIKHILEVCSDVLYLYEVPKSDMNDIKAIIDAGYQANHLEKEFGFDHEETFEILKRADKEKEDKEAAAKKAEREASKRRSDSRPSRSKTSNKHSASRDTRDNYRNRDKYSKDRYDRSPKRKRSRTRSKERRKKKYSRSRSKSDDKGKRGKYDRSDSEGSSRRRKDSNSDSKKKNKREKSRERSKDRKKDKERDDRHSKHKKDKEKHRDKEGDSKKEKEKDQDREKDRQSSRDKETDVKDKDKKTDKKTGQDLEAFKQESLAKSKSNTEHSKIDQNAELDKIKSSLKGWTEQNEAKIKMEQEKKEKEPAKEEDKQGDSSDEESDKLLELKKKIMENKKKGAGKK